MRRTENVELTNMCMICNGTKVLVQDRKNPNWPGVTFPGGHVEEGESFTDAVIREVKEETGLTISHPRLCGVKDWYDEGRRYVVLFYRAEEFTGTLNSSEEGSVWWEELSNFLHLPLAPDMDDMFRVFTEENLSEFYFRIEGGNWIRELK